MDDAARYAVGNILRHLGNGDVDSATVYAHSVHGDWVQQFGENEAQLMSLAVQGAIDQSEFAGFELPATRDGAAQAQAHLGEATPSSILSGTALMREQTRDIENAIHSHPPKTVGVYETAMRRWEAGAARLEQSAWMKSLGLSANDMRDIHHFLLAASFVSAWHRRHGNKPKADEAVAGYLPFLQVTNLPLDEVTGRYALYEDAWMQAFRQTGVGSSPLGCFIVLAVIGIAAWLIFK